MISVYLLLDFFYHVSVSSYIRWDNFYIYYGLKFKEKCNDKRID